MFAEGRVSAHPLGEEEVVPYRQKLGWKSFGHLRSPKRTTPGCPCSKEKRSRAGNGRSYAYKKAQFATGKVKSLPWFIESGVIRRRDLGETTGEIVYQHIGNRRKSQVATCGISCKIRLMLTGRCCSSCLMVLDLSLPAVPDRILESPVSLKGRSSGYPASTSHGVREFA